MPAPIVLFGAFDRHNLGDLLFPHVAQALLPERRVAAAGLAERDLRSFGGHRVHAVHRLAADPAWQGAHLLHAGGEVLGCTARQAAVMLLQPDEVDATLAYLHAHPDDEPAWRRAMLGTSMDMPYVMPGDAWPHGRIGFAAAGGAGLDALPAADREAVLGRLRTAAALGVRDRVTLAALRAAGIEAALLPDPAVMVPGLFGPRVLQRRSQPPLDRLLAGAPQGYLAVQLSAEFSDDRTLNLVAAQLATVPHDVVLFRAGAAPWHDDPRALRRLAARLPRGRVSLFESLDVWDLCALLASARAYAGSSLHGLVVATAFGVPGVAIAKPDNDPQAGKLAAYAGTWHAADPCPLCPAERLREGLRHALAADRQALLQRAAERAALYRAGFARLVARLDADAGPAMSHPATGDAPG